MLALTEKELNKVNAGLIIDHHTGTFRYEVITDDFPHKHIFSVGTQCAAFLIAWLWGVSNQIVEPFPPFV